jgi:hypothetical protein
MCPERCTSAKAMIAMTQPQFGGEIAFTASAVSVGIPDCNYFSAGVSIWRPAVRFTNRSVGGDFPPSSGL